MDRTPKPIGRDVKRIIAFRFGMYRYQAEHFNHNDERKDPADPALLIMGENPMKRGTKIYRFVDQPEYFRRVSLAIRFHDFLEEDEIKKDILEDTLRFQEWDPDDFKEHIQESLPKLEYRTREHVNHGYPECVFPYDKCPVCGASLENCEFDPEDAEDVFNARGGWGPDGEWSCWEEIHRCPECGKRLYIEEST